MAERFCNFVLVVVLFLSGVLIENVSTRLTEKQIAATGKLLRNMCSGKSKASPEEIDKMQQGDWDVDSSAQCYTWCILHTNKLMDDNNKLDLVVRDSLVKQLPEDLLDHVVQSTNNCEHAATNLNDKCIAAWEYSKCIYLYNPQKYFLP